MNAKIEISYHENEFTPWHAKVTKVDGEVFEFKAETEVTVRDKIVDFAGVCHECGKDAPVGYTFEDTCECGAHYWVHAADL